MFQNIKATPFHQDFVQRLRGIHFETAVLCSIEQFGGDALNQVFGCPELDVEVYQTGHFSPNQTLAVNFVVPGQFCCATYLEGKDSAVHLFIDDLKATKPGSGQIRQFMPCLVEFAEMVGCQALTLVAGDTGRYAWVRYGFVPTPETVPTLRQSLLQRLHRVALHLESKQENHLQQQINSIKTDPSAIRAIAAQKTEIVEPESGQKFPIGKYLLLGACDWHGILPLQDGGLAARYLRDYCTQR